MLHGILDNLNQATLLSSHCDFAAVSRKRPRSFGEPLCFWWPLWAPCWLKRWSDLVTNYNPQGHSVSDSVNRWLRNLFSPLILVKCSLLAPHVLQSSLILPCQGVKGLYNLKALTSLVHELFTNQLPLPWQCDHDDNETSVIAPPQISSHSLHWSVDLVCRVLQGHLSVTDHYQLCPLTRDPWLWVWFSCCFCYLEKR